MKNSFGQDCHRCPLLYAITRLRRIISKWCLQDTQAGEIKENARAVIEKIVLNPKKEEEKLKIDLYKDVAGILKLLRRTTP